MNDKLEHHFTTNMFEPPKSGLATPSRNSPVSRRRVRRGLRERKPSRVAALMNFAITDWTTHLKIEAAKDDRP